MKGASLHRLPSVKPTGSGLTIGALHPAYRSGRSIFSSRIFDPSEVQRVLKSGHQSRKIGAEVQKGKWRGYPIFTLTLEERATCPRSCAVWGACYGNGMHAAERISAGPALEAALWEELADKQAEHPGGFVVRLHVLGDFYSVEYAQLWAEAIEAYPALHVFGYTARDPAAAGIGAILSGLAGERFDRFAMRFSGWDGPTGGAVVVDHGEAIKHLICPAQTGRVDCCSTCAICFQSKRTIAFLRH